MGVEVAGARIRDLLSAPSAQRLRLLLPVSRIATMLIHRSTRTCSLFCTLAVLSGAFTGCGKQEDSGAGQAPAAQPQKPGNNVDFNTIKRADEVGGVDMVNTTEPPLEMVPPVLDFGVVAPNSRSEGSVQLFNRGDKPMLILAAEPSCKCTTLDDIAGKTIPPGGSIELGAVLDESPNIGRKTATIKILVDGYSVVKILNIEAQVSLPVRSIPSFINAVRGQNRQGRIIVESIDNAPFTICSFHGTEPTYLGFDPTIDEPRFRYVLTYDLDSMPEPFPRYLVIETDREDTPLVDVYLRHESTLPNVNRRMMMSGGYRFPLGRIEQGSSVEIEIPFKSLASPLAAVVSLDPEIQTELVGTRDEETPDGIQTYALVRVTPRPDFTGLIYAPLEAMSATGDIAGFDVFGVAVPTGQACSGSSAG